MAKAAGTGSVGLRLALGVRRRRAGRGRPDGRADCGRCRRRCLSPGHQTTGCPERLGCAGRRGSVGSLCGLGGRRSLTRPRAGGPAWRRRASARSDRRCSQLFAGLLAHELRTPMAVLQAGHEALADGVAEPTPAQLASLREEVLRLTRRWMICSGSPRQRQPRLKFTPAGGTVLIETGPHERQARLRVSDTGVGIPPDELRHVFDRFFRGQHAAGIDGNGIGLTVVAERSVLTAGNWTSPARPARAPRSPSPFPGPERSHADRPRGACRSAGRPEAGPSKTRGRLATGRQGLLVPRRRHQCARSISGISRSCACSCSRPRAQSSSDGIRKK